MRRLVVFVITVVFWAVGFSPDVQADHGYAGCGSAAVGCSGVDYGCHAAAGCSRGPLLARRPLRRIVGATLRVATAPVRAVGRARFRPNRYGCGG
jgi:hypothetical protein